MKNLTAILLLTVYLFSTTELHQLLKLPVVFEHFAEHREENKEIAFLQFLDMHYLHGNPKDKDYSKDMKLPFKTADNCLSTVSPVLIPPSAHIFENNVVDLSANKVHIPQDEFIPSSNLSSIWQPPRSC